MYVNYFTQHTVKTHSQTKYNMFFIKNTLFSLFILLFIFIGYSQDTLIIKENNPIQATIVEVKDTSVMLTKNLPYYLHRSKDGYHFDNGSILRMPAFAKFLQSNGMNHVWELYYDGYHFLKIGQGILGGGLALNAIGGILMLSTIKQSEEQKKAILNGGTVIMAIGIVVDAVSISIILKGKGKINQAIGMYNGHVKQQRSGYSQNISLHLNASGTNLGLILHF